MEVVVIPVPEFHFASMRIFMPLIVPSVVVVFSSGKLPLPSALTVVMGIMMLSFWEAFPKRLECPLSRFEPGFLVLGSGTEFPREASERRRNRLLFRKGEGGPWELWTEMEMVFPGTIFPEVLEFLFASMRIFVLLIAMGMVWLSCSNTFECPLSRFQLGFLVLGSGTVLPRGCIGNLISNPGPADQEGNVLYRLLLLLTR